MPARPLAAVRVAKPWGRHALYPGFRDPARDDEPIGEIWFPSPPGEDPDLLVKYLFTSERLSVQVHPDDASAIARGYPRGKDEAWFILAAEPGATIALGPKQRLSAEELRAAALDGSIVDLLQWRPVKAGDFIYSPAGTIHALGAGLTVIEIQQNLDLTYRLYDYGRARELHLDEGIACSTLKPFRDVKQVGQDGVLAQGIKFTVERLQGGTHAVELEARTGWLVPIGGSAYADEQRLQAGECWIMTGKTTLRLDQQATVLIAYPGPLRRR